MIVAGGLGGGGEGGGGGGLGGGGLGGLGQTGRVHVVHVEQVPLVTAAQLMGMVPQRFGFPHEAPPSMLCGEAARLSTEQRE